LSIKYWSIINHIHKTERRTKSFAVIFSMAMVLRLIFLFIWEKKKYGLLFSHDGYVTLAQYWLGWLDHVNDFVLHNPSPGFVLWCAAMFKLAGRENYLLIQLSNVIFSSITCVVLGLLARVVYNNSIGYITGFLVAFSPMLIFFTPHLQSESMFILLEVLFFYFLIKYQPFSYSRSILLGVFGGINCLTRAAFFPFFPFSIFVLFWWAKNNAKNILFVSLFIMGWLLPLSLWTLRNWELYHRFIPLSVQTGLTLYGGMSLDADSKKSTIIALTHEMENKGITDWIDKDHYFLVKTGEFVRQHPTQYLRILSIKLGQYWRPWPNPPYPRDARIILGIYYSFLYVFGIFGVWKSRDKYILLLPIYALFICCSIMFIFFDTSLRYRMPLEPFLIFFASVGFYSLIKILPSYRSETGS